MPHWCSIDRYMIVAVGLVGPDGEDFSSGGSNTSSRRRPESSITENELDPGLRRDDGESRQTVVLQLTEPEQPFVFKNVPDAPVPSSVAQLLGASRPRLPVQRCRLAHLLADDSDPFNRREAGGCCSEVEPGLRGADRAGGAGRMTASVVEAARKVLQDDSDPVFLAGRLAALESLHRQAGLSRDVFEVWTRHCILHVVPLVSRHGVSLTSTRKPCYGGGVIDVPSAGAKKWL